jgi:hypothetical protein
MTDSAAYDMTSQDNVNFNFNNGQQSVFYTLIRPEMMKQDTVEHFLSQQLVVLVIPTF